MLKFFTEIIGLPYLLLGVCIGILGGIAVGIWVFSYLTSL